MPALELPSWNAVPDDADRVLASVDAWASSAALRAIVAAFGGAVPSGDPAARLQWLEAFAMSHWDFRGGRERNLAAVARLSPSQTAVIQDRAAELGLAGQERPRERSYDVVLMTGGMVRAGIVKPRFVAALLADGMTSTSIVFLGGFREFAGDEVELAAALGVDGTNEFAAMVRGMELAFGPLGEPHVEGVESPHPYSSWREYSWSTPAAWLSVLAAPSTEPELRRANTSDTYAFWAEHYRQPEARSVLLVTTPIYVPYQNAGAVETLGLDHGLRVETVGVSAAASDLGRYSQSFLPQHQLQELRAAIGAMRRLRERL